MARRSCCLTTGTSGRTWTSWPSPSTTPSAAWISPASCVISRTRQRGTLDFNYPAERRHRGHRPHARTPRARRRAARRLALPHRRHRRRATPATSRTSRTAPRAPACRSPNGSRKLTYRDEHWNVRAQVQDFQTIDENLPDRGPAVCAHASRARLGRLGPGPGRDRLRIRRRVRELRAQSRRHRLAHGRGAARRASTGRRRDFSCVPPPAIATRSTR